MIAKEELREAAPTSKRTIKFAAALGDWTTLRPQKPQPKKIRRGLYSFDRLSEDELRQGLTIHYTLFHRLLLSLKENLLVGTEFYSMSADQISYLDFLESIIQPVVQFTFPVGDGRNQGVFYLDLSIALTLINRALGFRDTETGTTRNLTENESFILRTVLQSQASLFSQQLLGGGKELHFEWTGSPTFIPDTTISPSSTFVFFEAEIGVGESALGKIGLGYPATDLRQLLEKVADQKQQEPMAIWLPSTLLKDLTTEISVVLGRTSITTSELEELEPGDVLTLDQKHDAPLSVLIAGKEVLQGTPGIQGDVMAVRLYQKSASPVVRERVHVEVPVEAPLGDEPAMEAETMDESEEEVAEEDEDLLKDEETTEGEEENPFKF